MKKTVVAVTAVLFLAPLALCADANDPNLNEDSNLVSHIVKAAKQGSAKAQYNLGLMYDKGQDVPEDYVEAYKWCILAAAQRQKEAVTLRDSLKKVMSRSQIAKAQRLARLFIPRRTPSPGTQQPALFQKISNRLRKDK